MLTKEQFTSATDRAFSLLIDVGLRKNLARFMKFKGRLEKKLGFEISKREYTKILNSVNAISWEKHQCLFSSLVLCSNNLPGRPLLKKAFSLGAITTLPRRDEHHKLESLAVVLQNQVYEAVAKARSKGNSHPKVPELF